MTTSGLNRKPRAFLTPVTYRLCYRELSTQISVTLTHIAIESTLYDPNPNQPKTDAFELRRQTVLQIMEISNQRR